MERYVFLDHDGACEDLLAQLLLLTIPNLVLLGITLSPGNSECEPALEAIHKLLQFARRKNVPVGKYRYTPANEFPLKWRATQKIVNFAPPLIGLSPTILPIVDAVELMIETISKSPAPVTVIITGPCTNLYEAIRKEPGIVARISEVIWMAGALDVPGNVDETGRKAEWNAFADYPRTKLLMESGIPLTLVPLDVTNQIPLTVDFLTRLGKQHQYPFSNLAGQLILPMIVDCGYFSDKLYMWDLMTVLFFEHPTGFAVNRGRQIRILTANGNQGQMVNDPNGYAVNVVSGITAAPNFFFEYMLDQLKR